MADYKELLRRAIAALPENNGASRRAVYEKARSALVGQLRAIKPPLAARDITTHRLQLEDCIRQVEQEASEAVIAKLDHGDSADAGAPSCREASRRPRQRRTARRAAGRAKPQLDRRHHRRRSRDAARRPKVTAEGRAAIDRRPKPSRKAGAGEGRAAADASAPSRWWSRRTTPKEPASRSPRTSRRPRTAVRCPRSLPAPRPPRAAAARPRSACPPTSRIRQRPQRQRPPCAVDRAAPRCRRGRDAHRAARCAGRPSRASRWSSRWPSSSQRSPPRCRACAKSRSSRCCTADPQGAIDRAIATLDREARGEIDARRSNGVDDRARAEQTRADASTASRQASRSPIRCGRPRSASAPSAIERPSARPCRAYRPQPVVVDGGVPAPAGRARPRRHQRADDLPLRLRRSCSPVSAAPASGPGAKATSISTRCSRRARRPSLRPIRRADAAPRRPTPTPPPSPARATRPRAPRTRHDCRYRGARSNEALIVDDRLTATAERAATPEVVEPLALAPTPEATAATEERLPADAAADAADRRGSRSPRSTRPTSPAASRCCSRPRTTARPAPCRSRARSSGPRAPTRWACRRWSARPTSRRATWASSC